MIKQLLKAVALLLIPVATLAAPGTYVKGELGGVALSDGTSQMFNFRGNPSGGAGRLSAGQLWGDNTVNYGVEGGWLYFPSASHSENVSGEKVKVTVKGYALDLLGVAKYNFTNGFDLFGKAGVAYVHETPSVKVTGSDFSGSFTGDSAHRFAPELAVGAGYQFNQKVEASVTASNIFANKNYAASVQSVLVGLTYNIG